MKPASYFFRPFCPQPEPRLS